MMIVIITMIASYTNDDDRHHDDDCIVYVVYALAMSDAIFFSDGGTDGQAILGVGCFSNEHDHHHLQHHLQPKGELPPFHQGWNQSRMITNIYLICYDYKAAII